MLKTASTTAMGCSRSEATDRSATANRVPTPSTLTVLGVGTLFAVALLSVASERLQPIAVVLAVLSIGVLVLVQELSRRILILLALDAAIVFLYLWALDQPLHIVIQGDRSQYVVTVGDRTAAFPASGGGRIGLYTGRSSDRC